jgi:hypothetical protein
LPVQNCQDFHFDFDFDCTAGPGSTPPRDDCGDAEYALRLHFYLNGSSVDVPRQGESGCVESDEAIAWKLQQEWNGEQGAVVDLSSDSDEETIVKLCIICNTRPANKSSLQFSRLGHEIPVWKAFCGALALEVQFYSFTHQWRSRGFSCFSPKLSSTACIWG